MVTEAYNLVFASQTPSPTTSDISDIKGFRDKEVLEGRLNARQIQYDNLRSRRDNKAINRLQNGTVVAPKEGDVINQMIAQLRDIEWSKGQTKPKEMQEDNRLQYIIPHQDLDSITPKELETIQKATDADIIIVPFKGNESQSKLGCKIYCRQGNDFVLSDKIAQNHINKKLKEFGLKPNSRVISFFDKKNAIGGDYGDASLGITHQIIDISTLNKPTTNHLMQFNRNRGVDEGVAVTFISSANIENIKQNTIEDDRERLIGYLENKLLDNSKNQDQQKFYREYLERISKKKDIISSEGNIEEVDGLSIDRKIEEYEYPTKTDSDYNDNSDTLSKINETPHSFALTKEQKEFVNNNQKIILAIEAEATDSSKIYRY